MKAKRVIAGALALGAVVASFCNINTLEASKVNFQIEVLMSNLGAKIQIRKKYILILASKSAKTPYPITFKLVGNIFADVDFWRENSNGSNVRKYPNHRVLYIHLINSISSLGALT